MHTHAAILSIGDELTLGQNLDTNSAWLSARLVELGIVPVEHATVPDDRPAIAGAMRRLAEASDLLIVTGGLGPTEDDLTREALADAMGQDLVRDEDALGAITRRFKAIGRPMPERNVVQALRPRGAVCLPNPNGTAPGLRGTLERPGGRADVFCLPGPPGEMMPMFEASVRPALRAPADRVVLTRALHSFGLGESEAAARLGDLMRRDRNPLVGTTVKAGVVTIRVRYEGPREGADEEMAATERAIREKLGLCIFGAGDDTLAQAVLNDLRERRLKLATVESCTGGLLGGAITAIPGSSDVYLGGWVTYANELKVGEVGVPGSIVADGGPGAVSREAAEAMAKGGLERSGADLCVSITGIAGPGGGTPDKPVGTVWIGIAQRNAPPRVRRFLFTGAGGRAGGGAGGGAGGREAIRSWSVASALALVRFALLREESIRLLRQID